MQNAEVLEFLPTARGNSAPIFTITNLKCSNASGGGAADYTIAIDSANNVYATGSSSTGVCILVFAPGQPNPSREIDDPGLGAPGKLLIHGTQLWVTDFFNGGHINAYPLNASGTVSPSFQITGVFHADAFGFDDHGHVFAPPYAAQVMNVYKDWIPGPQPPVRAISVTGGLTLGMAMNSLNVFIALVDENTRQGSIAVYPDTSTGPTPLRLIAGNRTGLGSSFCVLLE